jgi:hypothetical protein
MIKKQIMMINVSNITMRRMHGDLDKFSYQHSKMLEEFETLQLNEVEQTSIDKEGLLRGHPPHYKMNLDYIGYKGGG